MKQIISKQALLILGILFSISLSAQQATIGGIFNTDTTKTFVLNNCLAIEGMPDAEVSSFKIASPSISSYTGDIMVWDKCLNDEAKQLIQQISRGGKIYFNDIYVRGSNGTVFKAKPFYIRFE